MPVFPVVALALVLAEAGQAAAERDLMSQIYSRTGWKRIIHEIKTNRHFFHLLLPGDYLNGLQRACMADFRAHTYGGMAGRYAARRSTSLPCTGAVLDN